MERNKMESLLIDYIDGRLGSAERKEVELMLADKEVNQLFNELKEVMGAMENSTELEMTPGHKRAFEKIIEREIAASPGSRQMLFAPEFYRAAAAIALVTIGLAGGYWINKNNQHADELISLRKEMKETKQLMLSMLTNDQSASQRMQGVHVALTISEADDDVVAALAKAMNSDANTNVRLAALDALNPFWN